MTVERQTYAAEMMERLGIDPGAGAVPRWSLTHMTAFRRCQACPSKTECRAWLDGMPMSFASAPGFCPNADLFFEMQIDRPGGI